MAQSTKDIKRRIQGIGSIMQITNAMELVSTAKLRKIRSKLDGTKPYFETVYENINAVLGSTNEKMPLLEERPVKNRAILIVAADKGLAGGYNINVVNEAISMLKDDGAVNHIYTTGIRSVDLIKRKGFDVNTKFTTISDEAKIEDSAAIGSYFTEKFLENVYDEVYIVYTKFNSMLSFEPEAIKLLPAGFTEGQEVEKKKMEYDFEPSVSEVLGQMIKQYINVTVYGCILESAVSEQAARRSAMENATSNGEELLGDLQLEYNRARQASITQEITEIVGGAEALN